MRMVRWAVVVFVLLVALMGFGLQGMRGSLNSDALANTHPKLAVALSLELAPASTLNCPSPSNCFVDPGTAFTAVVSITSAPASGYIAYQIEGLHPGLASDALGHAASGVFPVEAPTQGVGTNTFLAGALTGNQSPLPVVTYEGPLVEVDLSCPAGGGVFALSIRVEGPLSTLVVDENNDPVPIATTSFDADGDTSADQVAATLTINCVDRLTIDVDGDGCIGARELGTDETRGGLRDPKNPWDFYDVAGSPLSPPQGTNGEPDQVIDLGNDILGVILHFSPGGAAPYDVQFDRGPSSGPNPWNMTAPDGVIDLPNDILGVILQFGHDCR